MIEFLPKQIWIFQQPASSFFSLLTAFFALYQRIQYKKHTSKNKGSSNYPFHFLWKMNSIVWILLFTSSTMFHARDNVITEFSDYHFAFGSPFYWVYLSLIRTLWISKKSHQILLSVPFIAFYLYYCYRMGFVLFDYAFHMKLCTFSIVTSFSIWLIWCIFTFRKYKHCFWILLFYGSIFAFSPFELFDFPPLFGHFDAHSLWHAANCLIVLSLTPFIIKDANFVEEKLKQK